MIVFTPLVSHAQCIEIQESDYRIEIDRSAQNSTIEISFEAGIQPSEFMIQLYNFDNARYYVDESGQNTVIENELDYNLSGSRIEFNNVPAGDFGLILMKSGCERQIIGYGYSGFPDSAIRTGS